MRKKVNRNTGRARRCMARAVGCVLLVYIVFLLTGTALLVWLHESEGTPSPFAETKISRDAALAGFEDPTEPSSQESWSSSWDELHAINPDVIGWLSVPGTGIDHAIVRASNENPEHYLRHDVHGKPSFMGCPYLDAGFGSSFDGQKSPCLFLIYGHNLGAFDDSLFADFSRYEEPEWRAGRTQAVMATPEGTKTLRIFAAERVNADETAVQELLDPDGHPDELIREINERCGFEDARLPQNEGCCDLYAFCTCSYALWENERSLAYAWG